MVGNADAEREREVRDAVGRAAQHVSAELDDVYDREQRVAAAAGELDDDVRTTRSLLTLSLVVEHDARSNPNTVALELERAAHLAQPGWRGVDGRDRRVVSALVTEVGEP